MTDHPECLAYGAIISFVVSLLKKIPIVKSHPKLAAMALSLIAGGVSAKFGISHAQWTVVARCIVETFAASVATHETIVQPVKDRLAD